MKKLLSLLLVLSLIVTSSLVVYADDSDTSASPEVPESEVTQEMIDSEVYKLAENIVALESVNAVNATAASTHDVNDVYNLIYTYFTYGQSGSTAGLPSATYYIVTQINNKLQAVMSSANSINTYTSSILEQITGAQGTTITLYDLIGDLLESIFDQLTITGSSGTVYSAAEILLLIEADIDDVNGKLDSLNQYVLTLSNMVASIQTISSSISTNAALIAQTNSSIASNTADTVNQLNNLRNDFNNISWTNLSSVDIYDTNNQIITTGSYSNNYIYLFFPYFSFNTSNIFKIRLNGSGNIAFSRNNYIKDIYFTNNNGSTKIIPKYYVVYDELTNYFDIYIIDFDGSSNASSLLRLYIEFNYSSVYFNSNKALISYLLNNNIDFYTVYGWLLNRIENNIISKFEQLYASDDLIAAKEEQQLYESQAIEDFTGNGSAAASTSDLGDLKSVSGTIKSGLASGGSVSNALAPFDANGGFWDWFKQDNYNNINNLSGTSNMLRSAPTQPEVIDFYSDNQLTLQCLLGGN